MLVFQEEMPGVWEYRVCCRNVAFTERKHWEWYFGSMQRVAERKASHFWSMQTVCRKRGVAVLEYVNLILKDRPSD